MKLSIVIPSYNSARLLQRGLEFLAHQQIPAEDALEVIVVDDGSSDDTAQVAKSFADRVPGFQYVFRPRDDLSCRSRARNLGGARATGEVITFLDAGVLVSPAFAGQVLARHAREPRAVLLHTVYGLFAADLPDRPELSDLRPDTFDAVAARLAERLDWMELRAACFDLVDGELDRLPGAWALGWSAALTVPRALFQAVHGFDEGFVGWGDEDNDFVYRLTQEGASLKGERQVIAVHVPHARSMPSADPDNEAFMAPRRRLHRKRYELESELYLYCPSNLQLAQALSQLENMVFTLQMPIYMPSFLEQIASTYLGRGQTLLAGVDYVPWARQLATTHVAVHNRGTLERFRAAFPERTLLRSLCLDTPFAPGTFEVAVVTDALRLMGPVLQKAIFRELRRIARTVLLLHAPGAINPLEGILGHHSSTLDELRESAARAGVQLVQEIQHPGEQVAFRIVPLDG